MANWGKTSSFIFSVLFLAACSKDVSQTHRDEPPINAKGDRLSEPNASRPLPANWFTKDPQLDGVEGCRADLAYQELSLKSGLKTVVVAVVDSGVDIDHEDLQGKIWVNSKEIPDNGIDDDQNGYVDDIHGWNFLGSVDEEGNPVNIGPTTLEVTRELVRMKALKKERESQGQTLTPEEEEYLMEVTLEVEEGRAGAQEFIDRYQPVKDALLKHFEVIADDLVIGFEEISLSILESVSLGASQKEQARSNMISIMKENELTSLGRLVRLLSRQNDVLDYYFNEDFNPRAEIIGDDPSDFSDRSYGNSDVEGDDADHGTHVAGIIAAVRGNQIGIDGIATDVKIMVLRTVPNGDEYDKDVANSIRYAVDNGADIINMSFGKAYSPHQKKVHEAFMYAAKKGVLIVHAAGNSAQNNDELPNFPNRKVEGVSEEVPGWLEVGASSAWKGEDLPAFFSNYGRQSVDLFAPGVSIRSSVPEKNQYASFSGTSMASPAAAGVAALVLSQYPELTALELKEVLMKSVRMYPGLSVNLPFEGEGAPPSVLFDELSITGGVVDAYAALKLLESLSNLVVR